ncbi:hypothetical protein Pelo_1458 [Pelomyxa schiedti]|nr:hypothetical protein Pelo_1458 [Pelomyxa schiedti]
MESIKFRELLLGDDSSGYQFVEDLEPWVYPLVANTVPNTRQLQLSVNQKGRTVTGRIVVFRRATSGDSNVPDQVIVEFLVTDADSETVKCQCKDFFAAGAMSQVTGMSPLVFLKEQTYEERAWQEAFGPWLIYQEKLHKYEQTIRSDKELNNWVHRYTGTLIETTAPLLLKRARNHFVENLLPSALLRGVVAFLPDAAREQFDEISDTPTAVRVVEGLARTHMAEYFEWASLEYKS